MSSNGRPSALLTPSQRDFLRGETGLSKRGERSARSRIRERLRAGFLDAPIIFRNLPHKDIKTALGVVDAHTVGPPEIATARINMLALIHLAGCLNDGVDDGTEGLEGQIRQAISMSLAEQGMEAKSLSVNIEVEPTEVDDDLTPAEMAKEYSPQQLHDLAAAGTIDEETFTQVWDEIRSAHGSPDEE